MGKHNEWEEEIAWGKKIAPYYKKPIKDDPYVDEDDPSPQRTPTAQPRGATLGDFIVEPKGPSAEDRARSLKAWNAIMAALLDTVSEGATPESLAKGGTEADFGALIASAKVLRVELSAPPEGVIPTESLSRLQTRQGKIASDLAEIRQSVATREEQRAILQDELAKIIQPQGREPEEDSDLQSAIDDATGKTTMSPLGIEAAQAAISEAKRVREIIVAKIAARASKHEALQQSYDDLPTVECLDPETVELIEKKRAAAALLAPPITGQRNTDAERAIDELKTRLQVISKQMADLGGKDQAAALCTKFGIGPDKLEELETKFGGHDETVALLAVFELDELLALSTSFGGGRANPAKLGELSKGFGGPSELKKVLDSIGGGDKLAALTVTAKLSAAKAKETIDGLGAGFARELLGSGNDPKDVLSLTKALGRDLAKFDATAKATGLDVKPKALAALLKTGCKGKPADFAKFITKDFAAKTDQVALKGVVEAGGLGDAPDAFAALFVTGCDGKAGMLKEICTAFSSDESRAGLTLMLTQGGLKGQEKKITDPKQAAIDPACLSHLLKNAAGPAKTPPARGQSKVDATALATFCEGMTDGTNLKSLLTTGGLGSDPAVLGNLLGKGCSADVGKFNALTTTLAGTGGAMDKLEQLLRDGGFGTTARDDKATGVKIECLSALLEPGCDGDPAELVKLLSALGTDDFKAMKGVMTAGDLGKYPDVLAGLYKVGCLSANGPATAGAKDPKVLKDMLGGFADPGGPAAFKELLSRGGFADPGKEHRMGCVLHHAFTAKDGTQSPGKLRDLQRAFAGNAGMADLKATMTALEANRPNVLPRGTDKQPGMAMQNIINAPGLGGDVSKLSSKVLPALKGRAGPRRHHLDDLIQNAGSFEHETVANPVPRIAYTGGRQPQTVDVRMGHIATRHSRKFSDLQPSVSAPNAPTTLLPYGMSEGDLQTMVSTALRDLNRTGDLYKRIGDLPDELDDYGQRIELPNRNPHAPKRYAKRTFLQFDNVPDGRPGGGTACVGQEWSLRNAKNTVTQFVPQAGAGVETLYSADMNALRTALL